MQIEIAFRGGQVPRFIRNKKLARGNFPHAKNEWYRQQHDLPFFSLKLTWTVPFTDLLCGFDYCKTKFLNHGPKKQIGKYYKLLVLLPQTKQVFLCPTLVVVVVKIALAGTKLILFGKKTTTAVHKWYLAYAFCSLFRRDFFFAVIFNTIKSFRSCITFSSFFRKLRRLNTDTHVSSGFHRRSSDVWKNMPCVLLCLRCDAFLPTPFQVDSTSLAAWSLNSEFFLFLNGAFGLRYMWWRNLRCSRDSYICFAFVVPSGADIFKHHRSHANGAGENTARRLVKTRFRHHPAPPIPRWREQRPRKRGRTTPLVVIWTSPYANSWNMLAPCPQGQLYIHERFVCKSRVR